MRKNEVKTGRQAKMEGTCYGYSLLPVIRKLLVVKLQSTLNEEG